MEKNVSLQDKIEHLLEETRVVLPGTQALLGFQLNAFFSNTFQNIDQMLKYAHLSSLGCITITTMLLMTTVSYHQIVEKGDVSKTLQTLGSKLILFALIFLALGLSIDVFVVVMITTQSQQTALISGALLLLVFYTVWFFFTLFKRKEDGK